MIGPANSNPSIGLSQAKNTMASKFGSNGNLGPDLTASNFSEKLSAMGSQLDQVSSESTAEGSSSTDTEDPMRDAFRDFVGQTFFGQLIASMRSTQNEPAYFHGGQAEKIFQGQLDQQLAETLSDKSASKVADPMYELFRLKQR